MLKKNVIFFLFCMFSFNSYSKVCEISIIKTFKDLKEKIKICDKGDKLYLNYDIKLVGEEFWSLIELDYNFIYSFNNFNVRNDHIHD